MQTSHLLLRLLLALLVQGSLACSKSASEDKGTGTDKQGLPDSEEEGRSPGGEEDDATFALDKDLYPDSLEAPVRIELESPGREPRRVLRFAPTPGQAQRSSIVQTNSGEEHSSATIRAATVARVEHVAKDGTFEVTTTFADVSMGDMPHAQTLAASLQEAKVVQTIAPDGNVLSTERVHADSISLDLLDQLTAGVGMQVHLPAEGVGEGARWRVRSRRGGEIVELYQTVTFTLDRLQGSTADLSIDLDQRGHLPESGTVRTEGKGSLQIDLGNPRPTRVSVSGAIKINILGEEQIVNFKMTLE